ncbi:N-acetylglucosamine-6-phosphate deacetylase [Cryobacterium sp.]|jgi:N-acetylglucosamine-6-phosphate deacetylase|uniref:N-acetylglucosamine-6-phosphate deacetylase n=1 Tax=Cryobacterium sp. TaxID=1926290 RepID=UPI0026227089|nr:N-acetylglucosamine-6-phosphate deacetylase [Cryobacterium sp.]MCU1445320.1 nagA [Cryobacterium sp.]
MTPPITPSGTAQRAPALPRDAGPGTGTALMIVAGTVILPDRELSPGWVEVRDGLIVAIGDGQPPRSADVVFPADVLAPGFVDAHNHGGGGVSFNDPDPRAAAERIVGTHRAHGTTTLMASLVTAPLDEMERLVRKLAAPVHDGLLAGIHLEGPWLSPEHRGAHAAPLLRLPDPASVDRLMRAGAGAVRMVTIAPELEGGLAAVARIVEHGAVAAIGHTDADYDLTRAAIAAGANAGTHVFNAMRPLHHREPGAALALLEDPTVFAEVVADGIHLHPGIVRLISQSPARPVLVTDAMAAAGAADGAYKLGSLDVRVADGAARLVDGTIAGSVLTLSHAVRYAVLTAGVPLALAVRAASQNPADLLDLADRGRISPGLRADLVVLDADLSVQATLHAGAWVGSRNERIPANPTARPARFSGRPAALRPGDRPGRSR